MSRLTAPLDQRTISSDHLSDSVITAIPARWYLPASSGAGFFLSTQADRSWLPAAAKQGERGKPAGRLSGGRAAAGGTLQAVSEFIEAIEQLRENGIMSDPRRNDQSRRCDQGSDRARFWSPLAAVLTALGLLIGGAIGYKWRITR